MVDLYGFHVGKYIPVPWILWGGRKKPNKTVDFSQFTDDVQIVVVHGVFFNDMYVLRFQYTVRINSDTFTRLKRFRKKYHTPLKTNMSPENQWLEDVFPTEIVHLFGTC